VIGLTLLRPMRRPASFAGTMTTRGSWPSLTASESLRAFEDTLCDRLRDGPFDSIWELEDCQVVF
jgi:hypothetical protein